MNSGPRNGSLQFRHHRQIGEVVNLQQGRGSAQHGRYESRGGDPRQLQQRIDVVGRSTGRRAVADLVVDNQQPVGFAAGHAEFALIDLLEQLALVELDGAVEVAAEFVPRKMQDLQLYRPGRIEPADEPGNGAPAPLELPHARMMQYRIDLLGEQGIDRGDVPVERAAARLRVSGEAARRRNPEPRGHRLGGRQVPELGGAMRLLGIPMAEKAAGQHRLAQGLRLGNHTGRFRQGNGEVTHGRGRLVLAVGGTVADRRRPSGLTRCRAPLRGRDTSDVAAPVFGRLRLR